MAAKHQDLAAAEECDVRPQPNGGHCPRGKAERAERGIIDFRVVEHGSAAPAARQKDLAVRQFGDAASVAAAHIQVAGRDTGARCRMVHFRSAIELIVARHQHAAIVGYRRALGLSGHDE